MLVLFKLLNFVHWSVLFNVLRTPFVKIYNSYDVLRFYGLFI